MAPPGFQHVENARVVAQQFALQLALDGAGALFGRGVNDPAGVARRGAAAKAAPAASGSVKSPASRPTAWTGQAGARQYSTKLRPRKPSAPRTMVKLSP
jgi:hypothetical protein